VPNIKRVTDLTDYKSVLPYDSEIFGVYQPLIGWKSGRKINRIKEAARSEKLALLSRLGRNLDSSATIEFNVDCFITAPDLAPAGLAGPRLRNHGSIVLQQIQQRLKREGGVPADPHHWERVINDDGLREILRTAVLPHYNRLSMESCQLIGRTLPEEHESEQMLALRRARLVQASQDDIRSAVNDEAVIAGVLKLLVEQHRTAELSSIFFAGLDQAADAAFQDALDKTVVNFEDPFLTFDPKKDVKDASLSPIGVVHLYRQYFFELDTFLGTPTGHVWLSPGSTVELVEVSTRKTIVEKTTEQALETVVKTEKSTTDEDEISEAVKQENKDDLKLGVTTTVNQSWGTGSASATASLNMDKTQQVGRETTHKKMRQQTEKLSSEIRQNYKSTFKTITEATDTSSKRYVLANTTGKLINYELRRKMRQVAVQVQDIGSYLCWETFVDEPGGDLGLANLVHMAQPADLLPVPDQTEAQYPADRVLSFQTNAVWDFGDSPQSGFVGLTVIDPPPAPEGFEVVREPGPIGVLQISGTGEDFTGNWAFGGRFTPAGQISIGVLTGPSGLEWNNRVDFVVGGALRYTATATKRVEIDAANKAKKVAGQAATLENDRKTKEAFIKAAKERIELAAGITRRRFEELREEERIIVYRRLISSLMTSYQYQFADDRTRHVLSELLNAVFDIDKMLYFVAPEWWKPREHSKQFLNLYDLQSKLSDSIVSWSDSRPRPDNYLITEKSAPATMGSSLGWLLQLDGDNLRNAFLNAPWVKAVIPVRPGKEQAAMSWLQNVMVEGADGLDSAYAAPPDELQAIRTRLGLAAGAPVTLRQALDFLCLEVAQKHAESNQTRKFPETEINDDNKVTSTPIEKVYEHGFYPLKGGFRVNPNDPDPDPNNKDRNFQIFDQWIEVLPTDQVVPVEVAYDPKTGRQL
jgi:hypothetical protein